MNEDKWIIKCSLPRASGDPQTITWEGGRRVKESPGQQGRKRELGQSTGREVKQNQEDRAKNCNLLVTRSIIEWDRDKGHFP